jgi:hypothetical protein
MAINPKVLAQHVPAAGGAFEDAYTVPGATKTTASTVILHNTSTTTTDSAYLRVAVAGAVNATSQQLFSINVPPEGTIIVTTGVTLATTDVVRVAAANGTTNFHIYGIEEA